MDGNSPPGLFSEPQAANHQLDDGAFVMDGNCQQTTASSSNGCTTPTMAAPDLDCLLERLASLHKQLLWAKPVWPLVARQADQGSGGLHHHHQPHQRHCRQTALSLRLEAAQPALSLAHNILESIVSADHVLRFLAQTGGPGDGCDRARVILAIVMPSVLALDLYREVIQLVLGEVQTPGPSPGPSPAAMPMSVWPSHCGSAGFSSPVEDNSQQQHQQPEPPVGHPGWPTAASSRDLQVFLGLSTLNYYLVRMDQETTAGELALSLHGNDGSGSGGGPDLISLSIRQLGSTVRNLRTLAVHGMQRVLYCQPHSWE